MKDKLNKSNEIVFADTAVRILSVMNEECILKLENLAEELCK